MDTTVIRNHKVTHSVMNQATEINELLTNRKYLALRFRDAHTAHKHCVILIVIIVIFDMQAVKGAVFKSENDMTLNPI